MLGVLGQVGIAVVLNVAGEGARLDIPPPDPPCADDSECIGSASGGWCDPTTMTCRRCTDDTQCMGDDSVCEDGDCVVPCADEMDCDAARPLCDPDAEYCVECVDHEDCPMPEFCSDGRCVADNCAPGELACRAGDVHVCDDIGSTWQQIEICPDGLVCDAEADPPVCVEEAEGGSSESSEGDETDPPDEGPAGTGGESSAGADPIDNSGCACTNGATPPGAALWLLAIAGVRRRRLRS